MLYCEVHVRVEMLYTHYNAQGVCPASTCLMNVCDWEVVGIATFHTGTTIVVGNNVLHKAANSSVLIGKS